jgi:hypothetical protein
MNRFFTGFLTGLAILVISASLYAFLKDVQAQRIKKAELEREELRQTIREELRKTLNHPNT